MKTNRIVLLILLFVFSLFIFPACDEEDAHNGGNDDDDDTIVDGDADYECMEYDYEVVQRCWEHSIEECETDCLCGVIMEAKADFEKRCWKDELEAVGCMPKEFGCTTDTTSAMNEAGDCVSFGTGPDCVPPGWDFDRSNWGNKFGANGEICAELPYDGSPVCSKLDDDDDDDSTTDDDDDTNEDGDQESENEE